MAKPAGSDLGKLPNHQPPPSRHRGSQVLAARFLDMARPAKGLQVGHGVLIAATRKRPDVIAFEPARLVAADAPPPVALEHA